VWRLSKIGPVCLWIWVVEQLENELLDGRERLDCVSCPKREAGTAEVSADHQLHLEDHVLAGITALVAPKLRSCLAERVSVIDSTSDDRQTTVS
jgi:hypothetical protein